MSSHPSGTAALVTQTGNDATLNQSDTRVKNVAAARSIYNTLWEYDDVRRRKRSQIRNQIEGGRPFDPNKLKSLGRGDACNHNFRDAEAAVERAQSPFFEMAHDVPNKASFNIQADYADKERDQKSMADSFDLFLEDWGLNYIIRFNKLVQEYIRFGPSFLLFEDPNSARWKPLKTNDVLVPNETPLEKA